MVPLNPNELSREPLNAVVRGTTSTGIWNGFDDTIDDRCAFSLRTSKMTCMQKKRDAPSSVSYTHLTLPTNREV